MIGKTLGHYRIVQELGHGGMGEVFLADDLSLDRKVALKFLPDAFTGDPERMARFEREAKLLASLNHSNIAAIYGLEQAEGKRFLVLELVEGETLAGVLTKEPNWEKVPPKTRPLLRRCLEKDPKRRLRDIGEAMVWVESSPESAPAKRPWFAWIWAMVATLLLVALAVSTFLYLRSRESPQEMLFQIPVPPMPIDRSIAISPDGRFIAFVATPSGSVPSLSIREIRSVTHKQLDGTEGASYPFWSPDSRSIAFFAGGRLKKVDVSGGPPRDICRTANTSVAYGGSWNSDGVILFADWPSLRRVSAEG